MSFCCGGVSLRKCVLPERNMAPNVGPILGEPSSSATSIPARTMPGTTSRVLFTMASSAVFMSSAPIPGILSTRPSDWRRLTPEAPNGPSCPQHETSTLHSSTLGSMQDCVSWPNLVTMAQFVTTPATRPFLTTRSSTAVALNSLTRPVSRSLDSSVAVSVAAWSTTT